MNTEAKAAFEGWCVLELMGHRKLAGMVSEAVIGGGSFIRIDVPGEEGKSPVATQFYSPGSVYCITPVEESVARAVAKNNQPQPVSRWELPQLPAKAKADYSDADYDESEDEPVL